MLNCPATLASNEPSSYGWLLELPLIEPFQTVLVDPSPTSQVQGADTGFSGPAISMPLRGLPPHKNRNGHHDKAVQTKDGVMKSQSRRRGRVSPAIPSASTENITNNSDPALAAYRFPCEVTGCQKGYEHRSSLNRHALNHLGDDQKTQCPNCGRKFHRPDVLTKHCKNIHGQ